MTDDYAWLKDARWQEVLRDPSILDPDIRRHLEAENNYTESVLGHTAPLQKKLVAEMRGRIKEDDLSVPAPDGPFEYFRNFARAASTRCRPHAPRRRRRPSCSTATRWPRIKNTSNSAARGTPPTTSWKPGAPTPTARIFLRPRPRLGNRNDRDDSSRRPTATSSGPQGLRPLL